MDRIHESNATTADVQKSGNEGDKFESGDQGSLRMTLAGLSTSINDGDWDQERGLVGSNELGVCNLLLRA